MVFGALINKKLDEFIQLMELKLFDPKPMSFYGSIMDSLKTHNKV